jgi:hypothetical protein
MLPLPSDMCTEEKHTVSACGECHIMHNAGQYYLILYVRPVKFFLQRSQTKQPTQYMGRTNRLENVAMVSVRAGVSESGGQ